MKLRIRESFYDIEYLYHSVFNKSSYDYVLENGITADDQGFVYLSEKPIPGYASFRVRIPNESYLHDWEEFWLDDEGNEIDFDHCLDPNNKYYMYEGDIGLQYIEVI